MKIVSCECAFISYDPVHSVVPSFMCSSLIKRLIFVCSASASSSLCNIVIIVITLLVGVTAAADSTAAAASSSSEGNGNLRVGGVLHGFKNDVVQEQLNLHHHREQEDESVRGALRGFKKEGGELQKLYYYPGQGHGGSGQGHVVPTNTGYNHWSPSAHGGTDRWMKKDYSLTNMALVEVATYSRMAARAANETAAAAKARNSADLQTAVGGLLDDATTAEASACVAVELLRVANEEDDEDESTSNLIQDITAVYGIAAAIEKQATQTAEYAERAVVATNQPTPNENEVNSITMHTKALAQVTLKMTEGLVTMMISNAGGSTPAQDSLINTAP